MRTKTLAICLALAALCCGALAAQSGDPVGELERQHAAELVMSGADLVQSRLGDLTVLVTVENFVIRMPEGTLKDRGPVARILDAEGNKLAELLVIEAADLVVWKIGDEKKVAGPLARMGFPLEQVAPVHRFSKEDPSASLRWSHDFLVSTWKAAQEGTGRVPLKDGVQDPFVKDTVGCDFLHWLDNSTLRPCCDDHDLCYRTNNCTAASWNPFNSTWECAGCNSTVVACFTLLYWIRSGIYWEWCWGIHCCDPPDYYPCINIECT